MGGQLLFSYSTLFCATCLDAPEYVDGLWDYGGRIHRSAWFPASVGVTAGEAGVLSRDGWSADQNGGVARAVPTPERCRGRSSCVSDRARRYWVPRGEYRGCRVAYGGRMRLCRPVREAYEHRGVLQCERCNGGVFPAILNLPFWTPFVPSSHRPGHRRYPRRAFAMISCAPSGD
ncbi:hypothetical protein quinque_007965 [Culex quinquefasciatus]